MLTVKGFDWDNLNAFISHSYSAAVLDPSKRWVAIGNAPRLGTAISLAHTLRSRGYCSRVIVASHNLIGICIWIDILSWSVEDGEN